MTTARPRPITDRELTLSLLARQLLLERRTGLSAADAVRRLVALQAQYSPSPYLALHARLEGFQVAELERALRRGTVVKSTLMRGTLHLVHRAAYPAYASAWRFQARRMLAGRERELEGETPRIVAALADLLRTPRTTDEIRARTLELTGGVRYEHDALDFARCSLPLVHAMPSGLWRRHGKFSLAAWDGPPVAEDPLPGTVELVRDYLAAFGPATREDVAAFTWLRYHQLDPALERLEPLRRFTDPRGRELLDLPRMPLPREDDAAPPVRFLPKWDAALISHRDRSRIIPFGLQDHVFLRREGDFARTYLVDGSVAGTWRDHVEEDGTAVLALTSLIGDDGDALPAALEPEGERLLELLHPGAPRRRVELS